MAYKIGDKFIIEIDSVMTNKNGTLYGIKEFKSLVFDDYGLEQLEKLEKTKEDCCFKIGDIVVNRYKNRALVTAVCDYDDTLCLVYADGSTSSGEEMAKWARTGDEYHITMTSLLKVLQQDENYED